jgi:hypothetical protein
MNKRQKKPKDGKNTLLLGVLLFSRDLVSFIVVISKNAMSKFVVLEKYVDA